MYFVSAQCLWRSVDMTHWCMHDGLDVHDSWSIYILVIVSYYVLSSAHLVQRV
jgi:hypothetical protein